jgi:hypothetical protein
MLAKLIALVVVALLVAGPAMFLFQVAWRRGGAARSFALVALGLASVLVAWLFAPADPAMTREEHIAAFVGAWGMLAAGVGLVVILGVAVNRSRSSGSKGRQP